MYLVKDRGDPKAKRYHVGVLATTPSGYEALVRLGTRSHTRENFHFKPLVDFTDLAEWHENGWTQGLALTTGCYFGLLTQTLINEGEDAARYVLERYASLFPHTFVELQNHKIDRVDVLTESAIATALSGMATELGLPVLITQDSHYCHVSDKPVHEALKRTAAFGPDPDDALFPGDSFHLATAEWVRAHHEQRHWEQSEQGFAHLRELHSLSIPELDKYSFNIPKTVPNPMDSLREQCNAQMDLKGLKGQQAYEARLKEELEVLEDVGFAGYLLLVQEVTDWCAKNHVFTQARGSASGSLVCWLLGITQINPIKFNLTFEQFISRDRAKPPDVDLDVEDTRRQDLLDWLRTRFAVEQIGNYATYSINDDDGDSRGRGSLIVAYKKMRRAKGATKDELDAIERISDIPEPTRSELLALSDRKVYKSYGTHAAGVVVTTSKDDLHRLVPMMLIASDKDSRLVTQFNDDDIEALGLVKLDVLGLRTLSLLRVATGLLGRDIEEGLDWIPLDDTRTFTAIRNGATDGVFQLEGYTAQRGCKELGVRSLKDIIVIMALYRPGVSQASKDLYLARRRGQEEQPKRHPILMKHLKETYGISLFQEQVIAILRDMGMDSESLTDLLKAVKASQKAEIAKAVITIAGYQQQVSDLARNLEMSDEDFKFLWEAIEGFAKYGFKRAHATAYGLTAYRSAYLRTRHPLEFATALLQTSEGSEKEPQYVSVVRKMGLSILRPHINISGPSYSLDRKRNAIRRGLVSVKGIGERTANEIAEHAPYQTISEIIERCQGQRVNGGKSWAKERTLNGHLGKLYQAGVLGDLSDSASVVG